MPAVLEMEFRCRPNPRRIALWSGQGDRPQSARSAFAELETPGTRCPDGVVAPPPQARWTS
ncbi:hypothetical protein I546_6394 [Mycobacterium kansasii 732]|nr:hypothetical protein I546_6394 [Mycobacterium kansasii 732]